MSTAKYQKYFQLMVEKNKKLFDDFQVVHNGFALNPEKWEDRFHTNGREVLDVIRDWERRLCSGMERGNNAVYSNKLAEKFWGLVKEKLPLIEKVGLKVNS